MKTNTNDDRRPEENDQVPFGPGDQRAEIEQVLALLTEVSSSVSEPVVPYSSVGKGKGGMRDNDDRGGLKEAVAASDRKLAAGKGIPLEQFEVEMDALLDELYA